METLIRAKIETKIAKLTTNKMEQYLESNRQFLKETNGENCTKNEAQKDEEGFQLTRPHHLALVFSEQQW